MKKIRNIIGCTIASISIIFFLETAHYLNQHDNGFKRIINLSALQLNKSAILKTTGYYFGGTTGNHIYLANSYYKQKILETNYAISDIFYRQMQIKFPRDMMLSYSRVYIDSPYLFIAEGIQPVVIKEPLFEYRKDIDLHIDSRFNLFVVLSNSSFIIRNLDSVLQQNILQKLIISDSGKSKKAFVLHKDGNGFFSTDGTLLLNKRSGIICYVYRYRNEFVCLDTNLNLISKGKTIDTTNVSAIKVENINSEKQITFSAPPIYVNKYAAMSDKYLIIQSGLKASNENANAFDHNACMDIYDINSSRYLYSFYLPDYQSEKIQDFILSDTVIVALYDHYICSYTIK